MSPKIEEPGVADVNTMDSEVRHANLGLLIRLAYSNSNMIVQSPFPGLPTGEVRVVYLMRSPATVSGQALRQKVEVS